MAFNLVFVLPDKENQSILVQQTGNGCELPQYSNPISEIGESAIPQLADIPQPYNDFFKNLTGLSVFRKSLFSTSSNIVFVCEQIDEGSISSGYAWVSYEEFLSLQQDNEIRKITESVKHNYHNATGFAPHLEWLRSTCADKNISITGDIQQIKSEWVYRVPSSIGDLYLKIVDGPYSELAFTHKLLEQNIPNLPEWVAHNPSLGAILMKDMGGEDLSSQPVMKIEDLVNLATALSHTQKASISYVNSPDFYGYDYTIGTTIKELNNFPEAAYQMLQGTPYAITLEDKAKLAHNTGRTKSMLRFIDNLQIPSTIHNSDMAAYNTRFTGGKYIFYDWVWGGAGHPFFGMSRLLNTVKKMLPNLSAKEIIIDIYLNQWLEYGSYEELKQAFTAVDRLQGFSVMFFLKYVRTKDMHLLFAGKAKALSAEGRALDKRYQNFALYLNRFLNDVFD